jgi:hypothetical protein
MADERGATKHNRHKASGQCVELLTEFYCMTESETNDGGKESLNA